MPLALVRDRLVVGDVLGEVPAAAPAVPLQRDLDRVQRRLRLRPRRRSGRWSWICARTTTPGAAGCCTGCGCWASTWGEPAASRGSTGTFRETWRLRWEPELAVRVAEAGVWGTTVLAAATSNAN